MYFTQDVNAVGYPYVVQMSFELPYLDWCRFQKSQLFHDLTEYLEALETPDSRKLLRDSPNESAEHQTLL